MNPYVLVVDDQPLNLELARLVLEGGGFEVGTAPDGEAARRSIAERRPDLVLMDIQMPGIDGLTLTIELKQAPATRDLVIVAFTAYAVPGDEQRFLDAGFDGYLSKPIDVPTFADAVRALLRATA
ncbi:response regulator [Aquincola sp. S2]|uniref:Response regulator n=1 Tax=Pseudaquabacterium terrae TaxID=2732868 RepID=A0ABX2EG06_9BURK|nr:response regulator [Aquabacterium terrae]NRF67563.1 response regulator [Aquabacterium terrae]